MCRLSFELKNFGLIILFDRAIDLMSRVFANGPGDWGSISGRVISKTQKMVFDAALLDTHHYKVRIKSKVEQSKEWRSTLLYLGVVAIEKGVIGSPSMMVANLLLLILFDWIKMIYFMFGRVDLIAGQLKFKYADV